MAKPLLFLAIAALPLASCDVASDVAGQALGDQMRTAFVERCEQVAADNGIEAVDVTQACGCAADEFAGQLQSGELQIDRQVIVETLQGCVVGTGNQPTMTEETGG